MQESISDKLLKAVKLTEQHNSGSMDKPEVILWPDPDEQWKEIMPSLRKSLPQILTYGQYDPVNKIGPSIWIKSMISKMLPEADWDENLVPIIYLPGISKTDLRKVETAVFDLQPLLEYQFTGNIFLQENGKEWTVLAFVENPTYGLGIKVQKDQSTKKALKKALPSIFMEKEAFYNKSHIDAGFLNTLVFPEINESILQWISQGETFLSKMDSSKKGVFTELCKGQFDFEPDEKNIKEIAFKLGSQAGNWKNVWQLYANNPKKYPQIEGYLRLSMPDDLGMGMFSIPQESWPQVNESEELKLAEELKAILKLDIPKAIAKLGELDNKHKERRLWIWSEMEKSPLANSIFHLHKLAKSSQVSMGTSDLEHLQHYYVNDGYFVDHHMRKSLEVVKSSKDRELVSRVISLFYKPWLESMTNRFQDLMEKDAGIFTDQKVKEEQQDFVLFVDAFRYELAQEFIQKLRKANPEIKILMNPVWSAIPSLTPTAKANVSPIANSISVKSECREFKPQLKNTKDLSTPAFRDALKNVGFEYLAKINDIESGKRYWMEIGDIDTKGHQEQVGLVKRIDELFEQIEETLEGIFERGFNRVKIVTDHGWLLLPGGLPKTQLYSELAETRWGRCALMKEGVITSLLHLPWRWNPSIYIAYAPGISFFKANEEYAHGGISIHECLIPEIIIESSRESKQVAKIKSVKWVNLKCNIETEGAGDSFLMDIRTKASDQKSSIVISKNNGIKENKGRAMVSDDAEGNSATIVLLDEKGVILDKKLTTVGG